VISEKMAEYFDLDWLLTMIQRTKTTTHMDLQKFTIKTQEAIQQAQNIAESKGQQSIETGHLLQGIFAVDQEVIPYILKKLSVNQTILQAALERIVDSYPKVTGGQIFLSQGANRILQYAISELKNFGDEFVSIELLFYSLLDATDTIGRLLKDNKITKTTLKQQIMDLRNGDKVTSNSQEGT
jgi:ATP-dependent Clp protease ATP-binding subunit ClpB